MTAEHSPDGAQLFEVKHILAAHAGREGVLLPVLHEIQETLGFIPPNCIPTIAEALNLSRAEVHGVVSFYHDFRSIRAARPVLKLCGAEACQARGAETLAMHAGRDPRVAVETVYCLGLCASGPAAMIGDRIVARLDAARLDRLIAEAAP